MMSQIQSQTTALQGLIDNLKSPELQSSARKLLEVLHHYIEFVRWVADGRSPRKFTHPSFRDTVSWILGRLEATVVEGFGQDFLPSVVTLKGDKNFIPFSASVLRKRHFDKNTFPQEEKTFIRDFIVNLQKILSSDQAISYEFIVFAMEDYITVADMLETDVFKTERGGFRDNGDTLLNQLPLLLTVVSPQGLSIVDIVLRSVIPLLGSVQLTDSQQIVDGDLKSVANFIRHDINHVGSIFLARLGSRFAMVSPLFPPISSPEVTAEDLRSRFLFVLGLVSPQLDFAMNLLRWLDQQNVFDQEVASLFLFYIFHETLTSVQGDDGQEIFMTLSPKKILYALRNYYFPNGDDNTWRFGNIVIFRGILSKTVRGCDVPELHKVGVDEGLDVLKRKVAASLDKLIDYLSSFEDQVPQR